MKTIIRRWEARGRIALQRSWEFMVPPNHRKAARFDDAAVWLKAYRPITDRPYSVACGYAKDRYDEMTRAFQNLTARGDGLMRTGATLASLLLAAAKLSDIKGWQHGPVVASFVFFLAAVVLGLLATVPIERATLKDVRALLKEIDERNPASIDSLQAGLYHCATVGVSVACAWKAQKCTAAALCIFCGLVLLSPLLFAF